MKTSSPLRGKYLVKNSFLLIFLKFIDFITSFFELTPQKEKIKKPKKILLSNIAHLGDVIISTSILSVIKKKFPESKIGFICSSSAKHLLENHSLIYKLHILDHWKLNRSEISIFKKFIKYFSDRSKVFREILRENYDVAIDLYSYFPNTIYLLWKAKIKVVAGYTSAGFENFLSNKLSWQNKNKHLSLYHFELIKFLGINENCLSHLKMSLPICLKKNEIKLPKDFILFHIGAGDSKKMWDLNKWKKLTKTLTEKGNNIVFTGKGINEKTKILEIIEGSKKCINLCDKLNLQSLILIAQKSKLIVCVDSLISHISCALNKPVIIIFCGINNYHRWVLKKENVFPIVKKIPCSPCYEKNGCDTMDCLNAIHTKDVLNKVENIFEKNN